MRGPWNRAEVQLFLPTRGLYQDGFNVPWAEDNPQESTNYTVLESNL